MEMRKIHLTSLISLCVSLATASAYCAGRDYVRDAFKNAEFVPYVYVDKQITNSYGKGFVVSHNQMCLRVYRKKSRWISTSGDCELIGENRIIEEIIYSSVPLAKGAAEYKGVVEGITLLGVAIGDSRAKAHSVARKFPGLTTHPISFHGRAAEEMTFFSPKDDTNLYYRYTLISGKVVALGIGVSE
jgi:hypothetical protein